MKGKNELRKMFKGCKVMSVDVIDGVVHVFWLMTKYGGEARYRFDLDKEFHGRYGCYGCYTRNMFDRERKQESEIMSALVSMIDADTRLEPRAVSVYGSASVR